VLRSVAAQNEGITDIADAIDRHFRYLEQSGELRTRRRARLRERVMEVVELQVRQRLWQDATTLTWLDEQLDGLEEGTLVPFAVADALRARSAHLLTGATYAPLPIPSGASA
jgi:LAO/AO transport system kinase